VGYELEIKIWYKKNNDLGKVRDAADFKIFKGATPVLKKIPGV
jgi:hypothetical protein